MAFLFESKKPSTTIDALRLCVNLYMYNTIDGDKFKNEQEFEDDIRNMLKGVGFKVLEKHNVENTKIIYERDFADVEKQIPDIAIQCIDGLVFLELKFKRSPQVYLDDIEKVNNYLKKGKCAAAGVLFLDDVYRDRWKQCQKNHKYYNYWQLDKKRVV